MYMTARRGRDANARKIRNDPWSRFSHATKGHLCSILVSNIIFGYPPFHGLSFVFFHTLLETFTFSFISLTRIPFVFVRSESFQKTNCKELWNLSIGKRWLHFGILRSQSRLSYLPIGMYLLDVTIVYHIFRGIAISKIYEFHKNFLFKTEKFGWIPISLLQSAKKYDIIKR